MGKIEQTGDGEEIKLQEMEGGDVLSGMTEKRTRGTQAPFIFNILPL